MGRASARFLVLHLGELGIDDVLFLLRLTGRLRAGVAAATRRLLLLRRVHLLAQLLRRLRQRLALRLDLVLALGLERAFGVLHGGLALILVAALELRPVV